MADARCRYYGRLSRKLELRGKNVHILVIVLSSSALVSVLRDQDLTLLVVGLNLLVAVLSTYMAFAELDMKTVLASQQFLVWRELQSGYENLWLQQLDLSQEEAFKEWERLDSLEIHNLHAVTSKLGEHRRLMQKCVDEAEICRRPQGHGRTETGSSDTTPSTAATR